MRFSLVFAFSILTLSCFAAWIYQLHIQIDKTKTSTAKLESEFASFPLQLERDVKLLRLAEEQRDTAEERFIKKFESELLERNERNSLPSDFHAEKVTIRHIRSPGKPTFEKPSPICLQIYVPAGQRATWAIEHYNLLPPEFPKGTASNTVDFEDPIEIELPQGLSKMVITTEVYSGGFREFQFLLDGNLVANFRSKRILQEIRNSFQLVGGLIGCSLLNGRAEIDGAEPDPLIVAKCAHFDLAESDYEIRPEIGFQCTLQASPVKATESSNDE